MATLDDVMRWSYGVLLFPSEQNWREAIARISHEVELIVAVGRADPPLAHPGPAHFAEVTLEPHELTRGLRMALRQDPHVITLSSPGDLETAELVLHAGVTGSLVFINTNTSNLEAMLTPFFAHDRTLLAASNLAAITSGVWVASATQRDAISGGATVSEVLAITN